MRNELRYYEPGFPPISKETLYRLIYMVNQKNNQTFPSNLVGEDCILASLECLINSKVLCRKLLVCVLYQTI